MGPAITVSGRYEILSAIPKAGGRSYHARHKALGTPLMIHFLAKGSGKQSVALMDRIQQLSAPLQRYFIDAAEHDSVPYVVSTVLPEFDNLADWIERGLAAETVAKSPVSMREAESAPTAPEDPTRTILQMPSLPKQEARPPAPQEAAREFTIPKPRTPEPAAAPQPVAEGGSSTTGEFMKLFGGGPLGANAARQPEAQPAAAAPKAPVVAMPKQPEKTPPGEFTKLFGGAAQTGDSFVPAPISAGRTSVPSTAPAPTTQGTGEFTKLFRAAGASAPPQPAQSMPSPVQPASIPAAASPVFNEPGELTRLFGGGGAQSHPAPAAFASTSSPAASQPKEGEFTRIFGSKQPSAVITPPGGDDTLFGERPVPRAVETAPPPPPMQPPTPAGPAADELSYTRVIQGLAKPLATPAPAPPAAALQPSGMNLQPPQAAFQPPQAQLQAPQASFQSPQVSLQGPHAQFQAPQAQFQAPQVQMQAPQAQMQTPQAAAGKQGVPMWVLFVALGALVLLAVVVVVVFALKK